MIMMTVETGEPAAAEARISGTVTACCPGRAPSPVLLAAVAPGSARRRQRAEVRVCQTLRELHTSYRSRRVLTGL